MNEDVAGFQKKDLLIIQYLPETHLKITCSVTSPARGTSGWRSYGETMEQVCLRYGTDRV